MARSAKENPEVAQKKWSTLTKMAKNNGQTQLKKWSHTPTCGHFLPTYPRSDDPPPVRKQTLAFFSTPGWRQTLVVIGPVPGLVCLPCAPVQSRDPTALHCANWPVPPPRYRAVKSVGEKKAYFTEYCEKRRRLRKDRTIVERKRAREDFMAMLAGCAQLTAATPWKKAQVWSGAEGREGDGRWPKKTGHSWTVFF